MCALRVSQQNLRQMEYKNPLNLEFVHEELFPVPPIEIICVADLSIKSTVESSYLQKL